MSLGQELGSIDFESMIGGPLSSVIKAQSQSSMTSVDFIKSVGFDEDNVPTMVDFSYMKPVEVEEDGEKKITSKKYQLSVPILTMLPIPFIRVEETNINFNAKINSVQESSSASNRELKSSLEAKVGWRPFSASLKVSYSSQKSTQSSAKIERNYTMQVNVRAVQDELPSGTERLLGILEDAIEETPVVAE
ncbi:DUF2589 domain-containing protein [uncultured Shewanella sp.]|uniref:DUF2589 domain-containing protein n=1 Tax=uncultured Shewanella sp. TaxID=173975 RepID=UPI002625CA46|nr:DUF2589 domain-containing protein [uncultured Shewanella sp.]